MRSGGVFSLELNETRPGLIVFRVTGKDAGKVFANESGGHRWQRIPITEKSGRVQTSTVTVATFPEPDPYQFSVSPNDLEYSTTRSGGKGGQNANKLETCVILKHIPSGLAVRCEDERSQKRNKDIALAILTARLFAADQERRHGTIADKMRAPVCIQKPPVSPQKVLVVLIAVASTLPVSVLLHTHSPSGYSDSKDRSCAHRALVDIQLTWHKHHQKVSLDTARCHNPKMCNLTSLRKTLT